MISIKDFPILRFMTSLMNLKTVKVSLYIKTTY